MKKAVIIISVCLVFLFSVVLLAIVNKPIDLITVDYFTIPLVKGEKVDIDFKLESNSCAFTVADDGTIYAYEIYGGTSLLMGFRDGEQVWQADMRQLFDYGFNELLGCRLSQLHYANGYIYAFESASDSILKINETSAETLDIEIRNGDECIIRKTNDGMLFAHIMDDETHDISTYCVYDPSGETAPGELLTQPNDTDGYLLHSENYYSYDLENRFEFLTPDGNIIRCVDDFDKNNSFHTIKIFDKNYELLDKFSFDIDFSSNSLNGKTVASDYFTTYLYAPIGADAKDNIYFPIFFAKNKDRDFLLKVNVASKTVTAIEICSPVSSYDLLVSADGDVYMGYVEDGELKLLRFTFDKQKG
ncbi:MAG: hypothetical protein E7491_01125 [Ruminococcaceae bacterium]|nr:hypothetical protein [Oscillospiraceae bacterium]